MPYLNDDELQEFIAKEDGNEKCGRCRFWEPHEPPTWYKFKCLSDVEKTHEYQGACRRRAPIIVEMEGLDEDNSLWPGTRWDEWCGEFEKSTDSIFSN